MKNFIDILNRYTITELVFRLHTAAATEEYYDLKQQIDKDIVQLLPIFQELVPDKLWVGNTELSSYFTKIELIRKYLENSGKKFIPEDYIKIFNNTAMPLSKENQEILNNPAMIYKKIDEAGFTNPSAFDKNKKITKYIADSRVCADMSRQYVEKLMADDLGYGDFYDIPMVQKNKERLEKRLIDYCITQFLPLRHFMLDGNEVSLSAISKVLLFQVAQNNCTPDKLIWTPGSASFHFQLTEGSEMCRIINQLLVDQHVLLDIFSIHADESEIAKLSGIVEERLDDILKMYVFKEYEKCFKQSTEADVDNFSEYSANKGIRSIDMKELITNCIWSIATEAVLYHARKKIKTYELTEYEKENSIGLERQTNQQLLDTIRKLTEENRTLKKELEVKDSMIDAYQQSQQKLKKEAAGFENPETLMLQKEVLEKELADCKEKLEQQKKQSSETIDTLRYDIKLLQEKLEQKNPYLSMKKSQQKGQHSHTTILLDSNEENFYPDEIRDVVIAAITEKHKNMSHNKKNLSRRQYHILTELVKTNTITGNAKIYRDKVKTILQGSGDLTPRIKNQLESLGFAITKDAHYKLRFRDDDRYLMILSGSPSDYRVGENNAHIINNMLF